MLAIGRKIGRSVTSDTGEAGVCPQTAPMTLRGDIYGGLFSLVARAGVEPATFRFSGGRSYQLSYLARCGPDGI